MVSSVGRLHLITQAHPGRDPLPVVRAALGAGVPVVQVRVAADTSDRDAYQLARRVLGMCRAVGATCLVNDRLHVAVAVGADGGHVGADDLPVDAARRVLGSQAILGVTARDPATARAAVAAGASYLGVGPIYQSTTKEGLPAPIGPAGLRAITSTVDIPVIGIGGITPERVPAAVAAGAYGIATVAGIADADDPRAATTAMLAGLGILALTGAWR